MRLGEWLQQREYLIQNASSITVGTDGLNPDSDKLMSVGLYTRGQHTVMYISGANAAKVEKYTGVKPSYYAESAVGVERARELLQPVLYNVDFFVGFNLPFIQSWISNFDGTLFEDKEVLDLCNYIKIKDMGEEIPEETESITDLNDRMRYASVGSKYTKGYSLPALVSRFLPHEEDYLPELEMKPVHLYKLFEHALML